MWLAVSGGQPLFTLGLPIFALSLEYFLPLLWGPSTNTDYLYWCKKYYLKKKKIFKKSYGFKTWMGLVRQMLINLETSFIWFFFFFQLPLWCPLGSNFCKHAGGHPVTTEACTSLATVCVVCKSASSLELSALWFKKINFKMSSGKWRPFCLGFNV